MSLIRTLVDALSAGRPVCYTALIETRGSTPQKAGAQMLVFPDGSQAGTLGGGCVEAEVKRRALAALHNGSAEVVAFTLDHDYGWDDGLICGGRMQMLIDPCRPGEDHAYYRRYADLLAEGRGATEIVALSNESSPVAGPQWLLDADGSPRAARRAAVADALVPPDVVAAYRPLAERPRAYHAAGWAFLPQLPRCRLVIVGGGHVGQQVAALAAQVEFDVWVCDDRETYCSRDRFPAAQRLLCAPFEESLPALELTADDFCIIVTRGHQHDERALFHLARRPVRYLGMIGSRRKIRMIFDDLQREGIDPAALARVRAPLGLDIGSQTVPEIAVSIVAELISVRNRPSGAPQKG